MISFLIFGGPPTGEATEINGVGENIPSLLRSAMVERFTTNPRNVYLLAARDDETDTLALYSDHGELWCRRSDVREICLMTILPAKGAGVVWIAWSLATESSPTGGIASRVYSKLMHEWLRQKGRALAKFVDCPFREMPATMDC